MEGHDELGELAATFNRMIGIIKRNKEMESTLAQQEKMASLGVLSSGVAHEINNPLGVILGYAGYLEGKMDHADPNFRYIQDIRTRKQALQGDRPGPAQLRPHAAAGAGGDGPQRPAGADRRFRRQPHGPAPRLAGPRLRPELPRVIARPRPDAAGGDQPDPERRGRRWERGRRSRADRPVEGGRVDMTSSETRGPASRRKPGEDLRAVLHDEGPRHRAGARDHPPHRRAAPRRRSWWRARPGEGHHRDGAPADRTGGGVDGSQETHSGDRQRGRDLPDDRGSARSTTATWSRPTPSPARRWRNSGPARWDLVITDVKMPGMSGLEVLQKVKEQDPAESRSS